MGLSPSALPMPWSSMSSLRTGRCLDQFDAKHEVIPEMLPLIGREVLCISARVLIRYQKESTCSTRWVNDGVIYRGPDAVHHRRDQGTRT